MRVMRVRRRRDVQPRRHVHGDCQLLVRPIPADEQHLLRLAAAARVTRALAPRAAACALAVGLTLGLPVRATAGDSGPSAFEGGFRLGFALPMGNVDGLTGDSLGATVGILMPLWIDFGARIGDHLYVGPYGVFGVGSDGGADSACGCAILYGQAGLNALYHLLPNERVDPWFGVGGGYEGLVIDAGSSPGLGGWAADVEAGVDFGLGPSRTKLGPFAAFSLGQFDSPGTYSRPGSTTPSQAPSALHGLLTLGVRVSWPPDLAPLR